MNSDRYICCDERRRAELLQPGAPAHVSGIDYVEVLAGATTADPTYIDIFLVKPLPLPLASITGDNIRLSGGVRYRTPLLANLVTHHPGGGSVERYRVEIPGNQRMDFSTYTLQLVMGPGSESPPGFIDSRLSAAELSFKLDCPAPGDCATGCTDDEGAEQSLVRFDYRTRDYDGFRDQILDRLATLVPGFDHDDPVDLTTTIAEVLAYRADQQSYRLDWAGTEAFLSTARSRASVARHARLVDYAIGEGASARCFAAFRFSPAGAVADGFTIPASTPLLPRIPGEDRVLKASSLSDLLVSEPIIFETKGELRLWQWRNRIDFHTWSDDECRLPRGATTATFIDASGGNGGLAPGDFLVLMETRSPATGAEADARPERRHVVRLTKVNPVTDVLDPGKALVTVEWHAADALPFDLVIQIDRTVSGTSPADRNCAVALGNIAFCDHGISLPPPNLGLNASEFEALRPLLDPPVPTAGERWRPRMPRGLVSLVSRHATQDPDEPSSLAWLSGKDVEPVPALELEDEFSRWSARGDLLRSDRFDRHFVIETGLDGALQLRFGDGVNGIKPSPGHSYVPRGRFGMGRQGNIGSDKLYHAIMPDGQVALDLTVSNPLPAVGGAEPEPLAEVRINAPQAFREQERAVTEADYAAAAMRHAAVANARAVARWTGAWQTIMIYLDLLGGRVFDSALRAEIARHMERYRLSGFDIIYCAAKSVPLKLALHVCAKPGYIRSDVGRWVRAALRPAGLRGRRGFFHPDNFSFGEPLYVSKLVAFVMAIEGVASVEVTKLQKSGHAPQGELAASAIVPEDLEILEMKDDPNFPEQGLLEIDMGGGDG